MKKSLFVIKKLATSPIWSDFEDNILKSILKIKKRNKWKFFAEKFINKSSIQCYNRSKILNPSIKKVNGPRKKMKYYLICFKISEILGDLYQK